MGLAPLVELDQRGAPESLVRWASQRRTCTAALLTNYAERMTGRARRTVAALIVVAIAGCGGQPDAPTVAATNPPAITSQTTTDAPSAPVGAFSVADISAALPAYQDLGPQIHYECNGELRPANLAAGDINGSDIISVFEDTSEAEEWLTGFLSLLRVANTTLVDCRDSSGVGRMYTIEGPTSVETLEDGTIVTTATYNWGLTTTNMQVTEYTRLCNNIIIFVETLEEVVAVTETLGCPSGPPIAFPPPVTAAPVTEPPTTTVPESPFELEVIRDVGAGPVTINLTNLTIREEIASAPVGLKILILTGIMTVANGSSRNINGPPDVWLAQDGTGCPPMGEDATDQQGNDWCLAFGSMPGDGYKIGAGTERDFPLTEANAGYRGSAAVPYTVGEQRDLSTVFVCLSTAPSGFAPWSCVNQNGETLILDR